MVRTRTCQSPRFEFAAIDNHFPFENEIMSVRRRVRPDPDPTKKRQADFVHRKYCRGMTDSDKEKLLGGKQ